MISIDASTQRIAAQAMLCCLLLGGTSPAQQIAASNPPQATNSASTAEADTGNAPADHAVELQTLLVNEKTLKIAVPATWKLVEPRNRLIDVELAILPKSQGDQMLESNGALADSEQKPLGRMTMMAAGGDIDSNIRRWIGQFRLGRDVDGKHIMRRDERKLRGAVAHVLDIAGTYFDSPQGPFGPKVELSDYRMLGAIIEVEGAGKYFVKFYGPASLIEENREAFEQMLASLQVVESPVAEDVEPSVDSDDVES